MPWKDVTTMAQRDDLVHLYLAGTTPMTTLCERFGVSRKTAYKWVTRYWEGGADALADQSRRPHTAPRQTSPDQEERVLALADDHPTWGGRKLHHALRQDGLDHLDRRPQRSNQCPNFWQKERVAQAFRQLARRLPGLVPCSVWNGCCLRKLGGAVTGRRSNCPWRSTCIWRHEPCCDSLTQNCSQSSNASNAM